MNASSLTSKLPWGALVLSAAFAAFAFVAMDHGDPFDWPIWVSVLFLCAFLISAGVAFRRKGQ